MQEKSVKVFFSYSHKDEPYRESLETHLSILKRKNLISEWHDRKIIPGQDWSARIDEELRKSDLIILLVSSDFIASDYCYENEMRTAIELHETKQAIVLPVIIRPCKWMEAPFASIQALPKEAEAISTWDNEDQAWLDVANGIHKAIVDLLNIREPCVST